MNAQKPNNFRLFALKIISDKNLGFFGFFLVILGTSARHLLIIQTGTCKSNENE